MKIRFPISFGVVFLTLILVLTACNSAAHSLTDNLQAKTPLRNQEETHQTEKTEMIGPEARTGKVEAANKFEYRFYSPDHKHYIAERLQLHAPQGEPPPVPTQLFYNNHFIDSASYPFGYEYKQRKTHAMWVNNEKVLINGIYLFNIKDMTKEQISFSNEFKDNPQRLLNWRIDPARKYAAYITADNTLSIKPDGLRQRELNVLLYDLENKTWETIFQKQIVWMPDWDFDSGVIQVFWANDGNLYFNYPVAKETSHIVKYDLKTQEAIHIDSGYNLFDASPDGKYFIIEKQERTPKGIEVNYYAIRSDTLAITAQLSSSRYAWSTDTPGELGMVKHLAEGSVKKAIVEIFSVIDAQTKEIIIDERFTFSVESAFMHALIAFYDGKYVLNIDERNFVITYQ